MTKEEVLEKLEEIQNNNDGVIGQNEYDLFVREDIANFIIQQTTEKNSEIERLKAELVKTIETAKATSVTQRQHIERLQNELNELKESHKGDIENAYVYAAIDWSDRFLVRSDVEPYAEEYYKQKFESNE